MSEVKQHKFKVGHRCWLKFHHSGKSKWLVVISERKWNEHGDPIYIVQPDDMSIVNFPQNMTVLETMLQFYYG